MISELDGFAVVPRSGDKDGKAEWDSAGDPEGYGSPATFDASTLSRAGWLEAMTTATTCAPARCWW